MKDTDIPTESQTLGNQTQTQSTRPSSSSKKVPSPPPPTETGKTASIAESKTVDTVVIPEAPKIPSPDRPQSEPEEKIATTALVRIIYQMYSNFPGNFLTDLMTL